MKVACTIKLNPLVIALMTAISVSLLTACGQDGTTPNDTPTVEAIAPETLARMTCEAALLPTLDEPGAAVIPPMENWPIERQETGSWLVTIEGTFRNMLGNDVDATWECVVLPEEGGMRLVSFLIADL